MWDDPSGTVGLVSKVILVEGLVVCWGVVLGGKSERLGVWRFGLNTSLGGVWSVSRGMVSRRVSSEV